MHPSWHLRGKPVRVVWEDNEPVESLGEPLLPEWTSLPPLGASEVQVFALRASEEPDHDPGLLVRARRLLAPAEIERAERIRVAGAREEFVVGRGALRVLLGSVTGCRPREVVIQTDSFGKPWVPGVHCNVSHSRGLIYLAMCRAAPVGVDVEWIDPGLEALEIAEANFSAEETAAIAASAAGLERVQKFCRLWTCKEAVAKAHGRGLRIPLRAIHVPDETQGRAWIAADAMPGATWLPDQAEFTLWELEAPGGFAAALAVPGAARPVRFVPLSLNRSIASAL